MKSAGIIGFTDVNFFHMWADDVEPPGLFETHRSTHGSKNSLISTLHALGAKARNIDRKFSRVVMVEAISPKTADKAPSSFDVGSSETAAFFSSMVILEPDRKTEEDNFRFPQTVKCVMIAAMNKQRGLLYAKKEIRPTAWTLL